MTWIIDETGTRWVDPEPRKLRRPARAIRFARLKVGDQITQHIRGSHRSLPSYHIVTDLWFDPVEGQYDPLKGRMVGYIQIGQDGELRGRKYATTLRGLASQQFHYADMDYIAHCKARTEQMAEGKVVGIGHAQTIRSRPKVSGL